MTILDPLIVAQLGSLELKARRLLDGFFSGHYIRRIRGTSQEFSEHRAYNIGDDLKQLDWKIFGRSDRLVVKSFHEETNVAATVMIDTSASMGFSAQGRPSKLEYARILAAALGYLMIGQNDGIGLVSPQQTLSVGRGRAFLDSYFDKLEKITAEGPSLILDLVQKSAPTFKRKQMILVFSDLMQETEPLIHALSGLESQKHEVIVFQILDPCEIDLTFDGPTIIEDSETHELIKTDPEAIRPLYKKLVQDRLTLFHHLFRKAGIEYSFFSTDTPFDKGLGAYLSWRRSLL